MSTDLKDIRMCAVRTLPEENRKLDELARRSTSSLQYQKLAAAFYTDKLWPVGSTIKISFYPPNSTPNWTPLDYLKSKNVGGKLDSIEYEIRKYKGNPIEAVKIVINKRIKPIVNLNIVYVPMGEGDIRIGFEPGGSHSYVGTDCLNTSETTTMNFGWMDSATVIHELGHALGLIHEHQNPRGIGIDWNVEKVYQWAKETQGWDEQTTDHNILEKYDRTITNGSKYDPNSIMLYFFPASLTNNGKGTKQNLRFSQTDLKYINRQYPGGNTNISEIETSLSSSNGLNTLEWTSIATGISFVVIGLLIFSLYMFNSRNTIIPKTSIYYKSVGILFVLGMMTIGITAIVTNIDDLSGLELGSMITSIVLFIIICISIYICTRK